MAVFRDARFAFRQLRKSPGFTIVVLITLGLCIGANTAIYSVLDAVLLRPAPYPEPDRLAMVVTAVRQNGQEDIDTSQTGALFEAVRQAVPGLDVAAYAQESGANFSGAADGSSGNRRPEYIQQQRVSAGFFRVLGVRPQWGREFTLAEDMPVDVATVNAGGAPGAAVAVLSHGFWQRVFRGNPGTLGSKIMLKGELYTVIGVMPSDFRTNAPVDVWTPLRPSRFGEGSGDNYGVVARLKPGVSWPEATGQLKALSMGLLTMPNFPREFKNFEERIIPYQKGLTDDVRRELLLTWGAVLAVLLIGCVNVAGLMLARGAARQREMATRIALGGGRSAIVRQLLVESVLLALGGCVVGIGIGSFALEWLKNAWLKNAWMTNPGEAMFKSWHPIEIDARVMAAMFAIAVVTSVVFGLVPAIQTSRLNIRAVLMEAGRGAAGPRRNWPRGVLVAGEVALSLVLLIGAGLMLRTLVYLHGLSPGFDTRNVIAAEASMQDARYNKSAGVNELFTRSLERIRAIPGVQSAAVALSLPYERPLNSGFRQLDGFTGEKPNRRMAKTVYLTPGYFETMRIPMLRGRGFRDSDTMGSLHTVVVSDSFARRYFGGPDQAMGRHLDLGEIVGVAGDVQQRNQAEGRGPIAIDPTLYVPVSQLSDGFLNISHTWFQPKWAIRTNGAAASIIPKVQAALAGVDPQLPIAQFLTVDQLEGRVLRQESYVAALFSMLASLALALSAIGLYGLISNTIAQRRHEIGVRLALGATAPQTIMKLMRPGIVLTLTGIAFGFALSRVAVKLLQSLIWGVRPYDPATFAVTAGILLLVAAAASLAPALRVLHLDPAETLRNE